MAEEILLAAADAGESVHPGQEPGLLESPDRHAHAVAVTLRDGGNPFVAREAPPAAIGAVEALQQRPEHP